MAFHLSQVIHSLLVYSRNFKHIFLGEIDTVKIIRSRGSIHLQRSTCIANPNSMFEILGSALFRNVHVEAGIPLFKVFWLDLFFPVSENWILLLKMEARVHSLQSALRKIKSFL